MTVTEAVTSSSPSMATTPGSAAYGAAYAMKGYFKLNADNTIEPLSSLLAGWGDSMDSMKEGKYDPETGQISWYIDYAGTMTFYVIMNK